MILEKYKNDEDVSENDIDLCFEDIEALKADGRLFAEDTFEQTAKQFKKRQGVVKATWLANTALPVRVNMTAQKV